MVYVTKFYVGCGNRVFKAKDREIVENAERGKKRGGFTRTGCIRKPGGEKLPDRGPMVGLGLLKRRRRGLGGFGCFGGVGGAEPDTWK